MASVAPVTSLILESLIDTALDVGEPGVIGVLP
jgi:hypothetical protein